MRWRDPSEVATYLMENPPENIQHLAFAEFETKIAGGSGRVAARRVRNI